MPIPVKWTAGDTIRWDDDSGVNWDNESVTSSDYTLKYYLRSRNYGAFTLTGTASGTGWEFVISSTVSATFDPGDWQFQAVASKSGGDDVTLYKGSFVVEASLSYTGSNPGPIDLRSQAKKDLEAVSSAIRGIVANRASEYSIGDRTFKYADLGELRRRESQLKAAVVREDKAEMIANNLGNPHNLFVRF
jgi:hypothetical protein